MPPPKCLLLTLCISNLSCSLCPVFSTAPPSAPVSLSWEYESGDGGVSLRWRPPVDMGGRSEVWYGVVCRICPSATFTNPASCSWCGEGVTFSPSQTNLRQTKVTLNNLLTRVTYLIQVLWKHSQFSLVNCLKLSMRVCFTIITVINCFSWYFRLLVNVWSELMPPVKICFHEISWNYEPFPESTEEASLLCLFHKLHISKYTVTFII